MIKIDPFPAVRVNWKNWRFTKRAKEYYEKMNHLRLLIWSDKEKLIKLILSWDYRIYYYIKMPDSWSNKKKKEMNMEFHKWKPDIDNLYKATIDTLFYETEYNDKEIFRIYCIKCRSYEWWIEFCDDNSNIIK